MMIFDEAAWFLMAGRVRVSLNICSLFWIERWRVEYRMSRWGGRRLSALDFICMDRGEEGEVSRA